MAINRSEADPFRSGRNTYLRKNQPVDLIAKYRERARQQDRREQHEEAETEPGVDRKRHAREPRRARQFQRVARPSERTQSWAVALMPIRRPSPMVASVLPAAMLVRYFSSRRLRENSDTDPCWVS